MISVCMAVKDGERYIAEQIASIIGQLGPADELIVSDDHSADSTLEIVRSFGDRRIRIYSSARYGVANNFELALSHSTGDLVFLADQDDIWHADKLATMIPHFDEYDMVVCDCILIDDQGRILQNSFFEFNRSGKGFLRNLISNSYMGCCMGFRKEVLRKALPFPPDTVHDSWIGMVAEARFRPFFLDNALVSHRIHTTNASTTGRTSNTPHMKRVTQRYQLVRNLISRNL